MYHFNRVKFQRPRTKNNTTYLKKKQLYRKTKRSNIEFFYFYILGGFLLRKKQAIRDFAIAPAASLASLSPVATFGVPTILATVYNRKSGNKLKMR